MALGAGVGPFQSWRREVIGRLSWICPSTTVMRPSQTVRCRAFVVPGRSGRRCIGRAFAWGDGVAARRDSTARVSLIFLCGVLPNVDGRPWDDSPRGHRCCGQRGRQHRVQPNGHQATPWYRPHRDSGCPLAVPRSAARARCSARPACPSMMSRWRSQLDPQSTGIMCTGTVMRLVAGSSSKLSGRCRCLIASGSTHLTV
jgi:hypothetical protein